jgi:hypothetical protein
MQEVTMKRTVFSLFALLAASLVFGCHGESVTGPPMGPAALTGQIVPTGDLAGASPAGISVTCSGQVSVTDAAGRFAFASISAASSGQLTVFSTGSYNMRFTRSDGINAAASADSSSSDVVVYLQKTQASVAPTGSGGNNTGGGQTKELEGPITAISSSSITVNNASTHGDVKAAINDSTVIRKGNTRLTWRDLHVGDRVHVKTSGSGDSLTATEIMLQNPA